MNAILLVSWLLVLVVSYQGAIVVLKKTDLLPWMTKPSSCQLPDHNFEL